MEIQSFAGPSRGTLPASTPPSTAAVRLSEDRPAKDSAAGPSFQAPGTLSSGTLSSGHPVSAPCLSLSQACLPPYLCVNCKQRAR
jgi:hypothetical protein